MSLTVQADGAASRSRLQHFPVAFFAVVMGVAGFAIAVQRAEATLGLGSGAGIGLAWAAAGLFVLILAMYLTKLLRFRDQVAKELAHPIKASFFPAISIGLVLLSVALSPAAAGLSFALLAAGAALQLALTLFVLARWIGPTTFEIQHANPSWFIPVVGNILVPVAAVDHGLVEVGWFFFSVGLLFWLVLQAIVLYRLIFHPPLPDKLVPTLAILMAPPAVGFLAYVELTGALDGFARVLFYAALFTGSLLLASLRRFVGLRFFLSWWAYSFPLAALTIAAIAMHGLTAQHAFAVLAWALLAALGAVVVVLVVLTVQAIARGEICVAD